MRISRRQFLKVGAMGLMAASSVSLGACGQGGAATSATTTPDVATITDDPASTDAASIVSPETPTSAATKALASMTTEQKVAQLFFVRPEGLVGLDENETSATLAGDMTKAALASRPVGGIVYFSQNIVSAEQLETMLSTTTLLSKASGAGVPTFLGVDEEGGTLVARVANSGFFDVEKFPNMVHVGETGDASQAGHVGSTIGAYLMQIGFNLDFAPDADVLTNPDNRVIGARSFGSDPDLVSSMVSAEVKGFEQTGCVCCAKHFPGHGDTAGDSHTGEAITKRTRDDLESCEYLPFKAAIAAGVPFVMVGHISTPNVTGDDIPASLSSAMITDTLRTELGFGGVVISDSFSMGAITQRYSAAEAAVAFVQAGGDMILMPESLDDAYQGLLDAVSAGSITADRLDQSVGRILAAKEAAGIIS